MKTSEGKITLDVPVQKVPTKKVSVFYNPVMKLNRDVCILLLNSLSKKLIIADPLAGSGIRSLRLLKECKNIKNIKANDLNPFAVKSMEKNAKLNKLKLSASNKDANIFLLESEGFDYIDIDPFGSPNKFLDTAIKRIARNGILAVTATDTSALAGTYPKACQRKYWAVPLRNYLMHEIGIRILARKVQLIGAQYDKALTPVFSHSSNHYMRIYLKYEKGKDKVDKILFQHKFLYFNKKDFSIKTDYFKSKDKNEEIAGPVWTGKLWDSKLVKKMLSKANPELKPLLEIIYKESLISTIGFFDYYKLCSKLKCSVPKKELIINKIKKAGFKVSQTHFSSQGIKSSILTQALLALIKDLVS